MEEERGLTIGEIFKVIFKRVWWAVGVTVACLLVAVLATYFWYNANSKYYSVTYTVAYPDSDKGIYPDGTAFVAKDLISLGLLEKIKTDNEEFSNINVEEMYKLDNISIMQDTTDGGAIKLTLTVKAKYFSGDEQASSFIRSVASYPVDIVANMIENSDYSANLDAYANASDYDDQLNLLTAQKRFVLNAYDELIKLHGATYKVKTQTSEKSLASYRLEAERAFTDFEEKRVAENVDGDANGENKVVVIYTLIPDSTRAKLEDEITVNRFVLDAEEYIKAADNKVKRLAIEIKNLAARIEAQESARDKAAAQNATVDAFNQTISKLTDEKKNYELELDDVLKTLSTISGKTINLDNYDSITIKELTVSASYASANTAFKEEMDACKASLQAVTDELKSVRKTVYSNDAKVTFSGNRIVSDGGLNIFIAAILGAILGFIVVSIVICIIDVPKYKRAKYGEVKAATEETPTVGVAAEDNPAGEQENE